MSGKDGAMTLQQLRYLIAVAEKGSITEAANSLFISQPSLSTAIKDVEQRIGFRVFNRHRTGVTLTARGMEFLGYARQVVRQMDMLESKYGDSQEIRQRFCVSTQHYTFTANAFVELIREQGREHYDFVLNETQTHQVIEDVRGRFSDLGVLYLSRANARALLAEFARNDVEFHPLFDVLPHVFLRRGHPLTALEHITLHDLRPYPKLGFVQGRYDSDDYAEDPFSDIASDRTIRVSDRAAIENLMIGLDGYTIATGIMPAKLHGSDIVALPLDEDEYMRVGYIVNAGQTLSGLAMAYIDKLRRYGNEGTGRQMTSDRRKLS